MDPNTWGLEETELPKRIYLGPQSTGLWIIVSPEDYWRLIQYRWHCAWRWKKNCLYAVRTMTVDGRKVKVYLHKDVLEHTYPSPSRFHYIGDHKNGNSLDDTRENLRWATPSQNGTNKYGFYARQLQLEFDGL